MAATVMSGATRGDVEALRSLFDSRAPEGLARYFYDIAPDGQRFLLSAPDEQPASTPLTLVVNWPALLKKRR